jgi:class 3 adenylate cyclase
MWQLVIHSEGRDSRLVELIPGRLSLGRVDTNDIVVEDISASRQHAEIFFDSTTNTVSITDLNSTNGTFVNHQRITGTCQLNADDHVSIGQFFLQLQRQAEKSITIPTKITTRPLTHEELLEAIDNNSALIFEVARQLNAVLNMETAITTVSNLLKQALGVNNCEIILAERLSSMTTHDFIDPLARRAARNGSAEITAASLFVPIKNNDEILGLICTTKAPSDIRPFDVHDLELTIAISHQAALVIQRMILLERVRREEQAQRLLLHLVSPAETEHILKDYYENGELPGLKDQKVTILFSEIANSTGLAENLGTEHFSRILNGFYRVATQIIFKHNGIVKYLGDGVLAMFAEQEGGMPTEEKGIVAGRELVNMLNRTGSLDPKQRIIISVSINTGNAMVGYVGTKERAEFNVLGDTVNICQRMREYTSPYKIIVGSTTMAALSGKYHFRSVGTVNLHEKEQTEQVYELLP